ncbi:DUF4190 domain-containing protein [Streptomyces sp. SDr-06]|uniref:DUF4190 domain-containing protein n=1 Tax=Streptomyces sp. SDr-06 TaxID=2267702 RepID=UPI000DE887E0|nr:DUF4190 domain-containing protein [Streptomyces sp. SDr-06]RCH64713.1 DUF4190 domain-containing protein [Streptomyces sp. SDr-06]
MSDNTQQPSGGQEPRDPWAPPEHKVPLDKPPVHDQPTVVSMPGSEGQGPAPVQGAPGTAPAPGPFPGPPGPGFGGPTPPPAPGQTAPAGYGYPSYPQQPAQGYPGYPGQQPAFGYPGWTGMPVPQNGFGTAAMVLGIAACVLMICTWGIAGIVLGALALIFGLLGKGRVARGEANNRGQALAGVIMGIVGIVLGILILVLLIVVVANAPKHHTTYDDYSNFLALASSAR